MLEQHPADHPHRSDNEREAILATRYDSPVALVPPEVRTTPSSGVLEYVGPDEKADWDHSGRSDAHIWPAIRTVCGLAARPAKN